MCSLFAETGKEHILIIDDDEIVGAVLQKALKKFNFKVTYFCDSLRARNEFINNSKKYDLIIIDQIMPELSGIELAKEINKINSKIPILLYSGYVNIFDSEIFDKKIVSEYLSKPIELKELIEIINKYLAVQN